MRTFRLMDRAKDSSTLFSVLERLVPRIASAAVSLVVALLVGPTLFGFYAIATLILTAYQAVADNTARQAGVRAASDERGRKLLRQLVVSSATFGSIVIALYLLLVALRQGEGTVALLLSPLAFVPAATALGLPASVERQRDHQWAKLARCQLAASLISVAFAAFSVILGLGLLAASLQTLIAEIVFSSLVRYRLKGKLRPDLSIFDGPIRRLYLPAALSNAFGWGQIQLERVALALLAPVTTVGVYSLAIALSRSVSDAVISGIVNLLRAQLATEPRRANEVLGNAVQKSTAIALLLHLSACLLSSILLISGRFGEWQQSLALVPILSLALVPASTYWLLSGFILHDGRGSALVSPQVFATILSTGTGAVLALNLQIGALTVVVRETISLLLRVRILGMKLGKSAWYRFNFIFLVASAMTTVFLLLFHDV